MHVAGWRMALAGAIWAVSGVAVADQAPPQTQEAPASAPQKLDTITGTPYPHAFPYPGAMPAMPMWPQAMPPMIPFPAGPMPGMPMMWPAPAPFAPAPIVTPSGVPVIWVPFALVPVPAGTRAAEPAPVAGDAATSPAGAGAPVPSASPQAGPTVEPAAPLPAAALAAPAEPAGAIEAPAPGTATAGSSPIVDYGPVAPTPVVYLGGAAPDPKPAPRKRKASKPAVKPHAQSAPAAAASPAKQRLCWSQGVVAPCR